MPINPLSGFGSISNQQNSQRISDRLQLAVASLVSGKRINRAADDIAALSVATQLQAELSSLKEISSNAAQATSLLQVADGGAEQIGGLVQELRDIALQAKSPTLNQANRDALNTQFQQVVAEIDRIAGNTKFGGKTLLDGSVSGANSLSIGEVLSGESGEEGNALAIDSLSSSALFSGQSFNVFSADGATRALEALELAQGKVTGARADIGAFQQSVGYLAASIETAVANQDAARSVLADTDFAEESTIYSLLNLQREASLSLAAQGNRLPAGLLRLVE
ncbi:MAG: flagellin [Alphaproteobacteria bacterium]